MILLLRERPEWLRTLVEVVTKRILREKLLKIIREVSMDSQKIPVSPALQRLGQEFQAMYGEQIEARGAARGKVEGEAEALRAVLAARGLPLDGATQARIEQCSDAAVLKRWITRAATATTLDQVFAENGK